MDKVYIQTESFQMKEKKDDGVILEGLALPKNAMSRNKNYYNWESVSQSYPTLENKPMLFNHDENKVIGHVEKVWLEDDGLHYRANLDPAETDIIRKVKRGDIRNVSIQAIVDEPTDYKNDIPVFPIKEFLELSIVTIPGFADTTAQVLEKYKKEKTNKEDNRYQNPDGSFKVMTCPDNPDEQSKFCGCVRYFMAKKNMSLQSAQKLCAYIKARKGQMLDDEYLNLLIEYINFEETKKEGDNMPEVKEQDAGQPPANDEQPANNDNDVWQEIKTAIDQLNQQIQAIEARVAKLEEANQEEPAEEQPEKPQEKLKLTASDIKMIIRGE